MKKCLECEDELFGRIDKKFCSDQCRNTYNNRLNSDDNNHVRNINNILRKNRRILMELNPKETTKSKRDKMIAKGFNFNYFTNTYTTKDNRIYYYCYDYGYLALKDDWYALVKKKEWIE